MNTGTPSGYKDKNSNRISSRFKEGIAKLFCFLFQAYRLLGFLCVSVSLRDSFITFFTFFNGDLHNLLGLRSNSPVDLNNCFVQYADLF